VVRTLRLIVKIPREKIMVNREGVFNRTENNILFSREDVLHKLKCSPSHYPQVIAEKFPHVLERVIRLWHSSECVDYLNDLMKPNGSGGRFDREGFPEKVWEELFVLLQHHKKSSSQTRFSR
jgi:hypothetical protein